MESKTISIIVLCRNKEKHIASCLDSIINSDYPKDLIEVKVVDGMRSDNTREIVREYSKKCNFIKMIDNIKQKTPFALNLGI